MPGLTNGRQHRTRADWGHRAPAPELTQADRFLAQWVPKIMASPAFRDGGRIVITFDEGSDSAACCGETSSQPQPRGPVYRPDLARGRRLRCIHAGAAAAGASVRPGETIVT